MAGAGRIVLAATLGLLTSGCVYSSQVKKEPLEPPKKFVGAPDAARAQVPSRWLRAFATPQLDRLVRRALKHNLDLEAARARVDQARASLMLAGAGWYPRVTAKGEVGYSQSSLKLPSMVPGGESTSTEVTRASYGMSLGVSYEVDLWGKVRFAHKAAKHDLAASSEDLAAARISIAAQLADAYFLAVELRAQISLLDSTIKNREANLELVKRRYGEGMVTALDIYQAEEILARARAQRTTYQQRVRTTEHAVSVLAGQFPKAGITGTLERLPRKVRDVPPGLPAQLLLRRPDLRAAHLRLMASDARVGQAVAGHYPSLTLSASIGASFDPTSLLWNLLAGLTAPLFEGRRVEAQVNQQKALLRLQLITYKSTLLRAVREVEDALATGQTLRRKVVFLERRVEASRRAMRLATHQYRQGLTSYIVVLTAQNSTYTAQAELLSARRELISSRIQLVRALGGGWSPDSKTPAPTPPPKKATGVPNAG